MANFTKDPDAVLDYEINWAAWLGEDTIVTSTWIPGDGEGDDALAIASQTHTDTTTTIWLTGGAARSNAYPLTNRITTAGGRTEDRTIRIQVEER